MTAKEDRQKIKDIQRALTNFDKKLPLCKDGSDKEYTGNPHYCIGWIKAIVFR